MDIINAEIHELGLNNSQAKRFSKIAVSIMAYHADWEGFGPLIPFVNQNAENELNRLNVPPHIWGITEMGALLKACIEDQVI